MNKDAREELLGKLLKPDKNVRVIDRPHKVIQKLADGTLAEYNYLRKEELRRPRNFIALGEFTKLLKKFDNFDRPTVWVMLVDLHRSLYNGDSSSSSVAIEPEPGIID